MYSKHFAQVVRSGPSAYWPLGGDASDVIGSNDGTYVSSPTTNNESIIVGDHSHCVLLDGTADHMTFATPSAFQFAASDPFSISMWINDNGSTGTNALLGADATEGYDISHTAAGSVINFVLTDGVTTHTISTGDNFANTAHVCATSDGTTMELYVNGVASGSPVTITATDPDYTGVTVNMGSKNGTSQFFAGQMSNLALWTRGLSAAEVFALFVSGRSAVKLRTRLRASGFFNAVGIIGP